MVLASAVFFALTGCNKKAPQSSTFDEQTNSATTVETTQATTVESTDTTAQAMPEGPVTFENIPVDSNNPIDKAVEGMFNEADTTLKINRASESYYNAWKDELEEIVTICREDNISGFSQNEYNRILTAAQAAYDAGMQSGGSEATGSAFFSAGTIYKQGTYYFASLYKSHSGKDYTYIYKQ